jgi:serine/threonine protein kinase
LYIAIEWANKGDLKGYIRSCAMQSEKIECEKIVDYVKQLAEALHHMHEKRIIHRDLKPANILIFGDGTLKLSDLGLGRYMSNETIKAFSRVGTPLYMSPEVVIFYNTDYKRCWLRF